MTKTIRTVKPLAAKPKLLSDVSEGIEPIFSAPYIRFLPDANPGFSFVSKEEAERIAAPITECPLCDAGIPLKGKKNDSWS